MPPADYNLDAPVTNLKYIGESRSKALMNAGIRTIRDLLFFFPTKYINRSKMLTVAAAYDYVKKGYSDEITLVVRVIEKVTKYVRGKEILIVAFGDDTGGCEGVWFQGSKFIKDRFNEGDLFAISGKPALSQFMHLQLHHPDNDKISDDENTVKLFNTGGIIPFYKISDSFKTSMISVYGLRRIINNALNYWIGAVEETLPDFVIKKAGIMPLKDAIRHIHFPPGEKELEAARYRFKFEELFYFEILNAVRKAKIRFEHKGIKFSIKTSLIKDFLSVLPFQLTESQLKVLSEIKKDMLSAQPMNRLVQGDVGSGKTIVAVISALIAIDNGYQAVLMAPTEILANQHCKNISLLFDLYNEKHSAGKKLTVEMISGSQTKKQREKAVERITGGGTDIIVGTHALFEDTTAFANAGLIIIDEQHRFGVAQRARLLSKGITPDCLVMSATPIPRTMSMTYYGDLDISVIDKLPPGRIPPKTALRGENALPSVYEFIYDRVKEGDQAFIVFPLVDESEKLDLQAAITAYEDLKESWFRDIRTGLLHGKMKWKEKEEVMLKFARHEFDVLISTTVIEVGIDIPNSTIMVIRDAHRFGLSQLHQLRGRIGRGKKESYCILITKDELAASSERIKDVTYLPDYIREKLRTQTRLKAMVQFHDGFKIAEIDWKIRGPGDIFSTRQSGYPDFKYTDLREDIAILEKAKNIAFEIIDADRFLRHPDNYIISRNFFHHYSENLKYFNIA